MKLGPVTLVDGFLVLGPEATIESIGPAAELLFQMHSNVNWWIGDLVNFGEARFGDDIWQVVPETVSESFVGRVVAHAKKFKPSERVVGASWTAHSMVARHRPEVRRELLERAVEERMDTAQFKKFVGDFFAWKDLP